MSHRQRLAVLAIVSMHAYACGSGRSALPTSPSPTSPAPGTYRIMSANRVTPAAIVAWFNARTPRPPGSYVATVPVETLATIFIEEGAAEGVTGDIAFVQSVVETGWFRFSGTIAPGHNNFAGIGATDTSPAPAAFPDARTGVRAQIQHLRAYADASATSCTMPPLHHPCVDPRFNLVLPKGRAPTWNEFGNGNWASSPTYAASILALFAELLAFAGT